jgi:hydroxyacid-oxoacid transhydrogenase
MTRVALFTDAGVARLEPVATCARRYGPPASTSRSMPARRSSRPTSRFAPRPRSRARGASTVTSRSAAVPASTRPRPRTSTRPIRPEFATYVNAPAGAGRPVPGPLRPHIACPTTSGTGSEVTGIAIFDYVELQREDGHRFAAACAPTSPSSIPTARHAAAHGGGLQRLRRALARARKLHALPYVRRARPASPAARPMSQGANPSAIWPASKPCAFSAHSSCAPSRRRRR